MRVLVVEDEPRLVDALKSVLTKNKYAFDVAMNGRDGLFHGREYDYDVAIIDLGLPEINGIELIRTLRAEGKTYPIIILTARSNWQQKVIGLEVGADDYLVKPFINEELIARLNALVRRSAGSATPVIVAGAISLDTAKKTASVNDIEIELTSYEYNTLEYLILKKDKVVSKVELTEHLYDQDYDRDSNVIEVFVGRLRKKLDPTGEIKPITTVRGQGYRINY
ncbi:MAG: response regulator transcription factor [Saccharospirillaceae bacterium]|nr:response regulator transcription factor [Pseudomonadales bacterium]NRB81941.1 response regulator transcription factor [Saccharospirillaceae bacterium]